MLLDWKVYMVGNANILAWHALENICRIGLNSHHMLWDSCEFELIYEMTEVLILMLKGH